MKYETVDMAELGLMVSHGWRIASFSLEQGVVANDNQTAAPAGLSAKLTMDYGQLKAKTTSYHVAVFLTPGSEAEELRILKQFKEQSDANWSLALEQFATVLDGARECASA